jgi:phosphotransferase system HPr (HPr) family protein
MHLSSRDADLAGILVVDDHRDTAESMARLLKVFGHDVRIALDGYQAIEVARSQRPRCALLDVGLPGLDGYQVASRLRREVSESMVLIAITGYGREEDRRSALAAGFDHYFVKPLDEATLNALLAMLDCGPRARPTAPVAPPLPRADDMSAAAPSPPDQPGGSSTGGDAAQRASPRHEVAGGSGRPGHRASREVEISNASGFHLRAASQFARLAQQFRADVRVARDGRQADGRSIIDLTTLAAECGARLEMEANGPDAEAALDALSRLVECGFGEMVECGLGEKEL